MKSTQNQEKQRSKLALPVAAAVADAVGRFGTGFMFGASVDCGIMGFFVSCQEKSHTNAKTSKI